MISPYSNASMIREEVTLVILLLHIYKNEGRKLGQDPFPRIVTGTLTVKYILPTPKRRPITLRAKVKEATEKKITVSCSVYSRKKLCATGEVIAIRVGQ